jgi:hypothetical protein
MHKIFICYRHAGAPHAAGRLGDNLREQFGEEQVFRDREDMRGGASWRQQVLHAISAQSALVVLIDREWSDPGQAVGRRRLDDPTDPIRMEIRDGLADDAVIIPVLLDGAQMPDEAALPADIGALAGIHALPLRDTDWATDFSRIARLLEGAGFRRASLPAPAPPPVTARPQPQAVAKRGSPAKVVLACVGGGLGLLVVAAMAASVQPNPNPVPGPVVPPAVVPAAMIPAPPPAAPEIPVLEGNWTDAADSSPIIFAQAGNVVRMTTTSGGVSLDWNGALVGRRLELTMVVQGMTAARLNMSLSDDDRTLRGTLVTADGKVLQVTFNR